MFATAAARRSTGAAARIWRSISTSTRRLTPDEPSRLRGVQEFLDFRRAHPEQCAVVVGALDEWPLLGPD